MPPSERASAKAIFDEAAEIASPELRAAYLERACGGDAGLRARVEALLHADAVAGSFLESPANPGTAAGPGFRLWRGDTTFAADPAPSPPAAGEPAALARRLGNFDVRGVRALSWRALPQATTRRGTGPG